MAMQIAVVQFGPIFKDVVGNVDRLTHIIRLAASEGAELIVLPELCTTGYSFMGVKDAAPYAEHAKGATFQVMAALSTELKVAICWGYLETAGPQLYNAQSLVLPGQGLVAHYRKRNLWGNDFLWATVGDVSPPIVTWQGKRIGLLICRDIRNKNDVKDTLYEAGDADVVAFSSNFGKGGFPSVTWMDFATEKQIHLAVSNRYGEESHNDFGAGGVCIIYPDGKVACQGLEWGKDCFVLANI
jgi:predicted amidohydrolase